DHLGVRRVPDSLRTLARGRRKIFLVRVHDVGQPAPEEDWLRRHARLVGEDRLQVASILTFVPADGDAFFGPEPGPTPDHWGRALAPAGSPPVRFGLGRPARR